MGGSLRTLVELANYPNCDHHCESTLLSSTMVFSKLRVRALSEIIPSGGLGFNKLMQARGSYPPVDIRVIR